MANEFYDHTNFPQSNSLGSSALMRAELAAIEVGFDKLVAPSTHANQLVYVNAGGTGYTAVAGLQFNGSTLTLNGTLAGSGLTITSPTISGGTITGLASPLPIASGGTAGITAAAALANLGGLALAGGVMTGILDLDGKECILDADGDSSLTADVDDRLDLKLQGFDAFLFDGTTTTIINGLSFNASAAGGPVSINAQGSDADIDITVSTKGVGEFNVNGYLWSGSWTPDLLFGGANTGMTYGTQTGYWVRIGDLVFVQIRIVLTAVGSSTGNATITLPTILTTSSAPAGVIPVGYFINASGLAGSVFAMADAPTGSPATSVLSLWNYNDSSGTGSGVQVGHTNFSATSEINLAGWFRAA